MANVALKDLFLHSPGKVIAFSFRGETVEQSDSSRSILIRSIDRMQETGSAFSLFYFEFYFIYGVFVT